jgi:glycogen operon protein
VLDESFLLVFNGHHEDHEFTVPDGKFGDEWTVVLDTGRPEMETAAEDVTAGDQVKMVHHSLMLLRRLQT